MFAWLLPMIVSMIALKYLQVEAVVVFRTLSTFGVALGDRCTPTPTIQTACQYRFDTAKVLLWQAVHPASACVYDRDRRRRRTPPPLKYQPLVGIILTWSAGPLCFV